MTSSIGLHTMWNEHFGIVMVDFMVCHIISCQDSYHMSYHIMSRTISYVISYHVRNHIICHVISSVLSYWTIPCPTTICVAVFDIMSIALWSDCSSCDMIWYDYINATQATALHISMIWYDMIWYDMMNRRLELYL